MNPSESADDPKVGLGLPLLLPKINAFKAGIGAKLLPGLGAAGIALNPALAPIAIPAKLAALKAKLGLGLLVSVFLPLSLLCILVRQTEINKMFFFFLSFYQPLAPLI